MQKEDLSADNTMTPVNAGLLYRRDSILAIRCLPQSQNNIVKYRELWNCLYNINFTAVCQVGMMTHGKCCIDRLFPYHMTGVRWEPSPSAQV